MVSVNRGVALLDRENPDWANEIDLDELDISSNFHCVLGQLYGEFEKGSRRLGISSDRAQERHGFYRPSGRYSRTQAAWHKVIRERQAV